MNFCPKCNEREKPDSLKHCMPCARKKGSLLAQIVFFIVLALGLFFAIYLKNTGYIPSEGLIDWLTNYGKSLFSQNDWAKTQIITLISIVVIALLSAIIIYIVTLKKNKQ